jgi:hypothetical protein
LRHYSRSQEIKVGERPGWYSAHAAEHLAENDNPQHRLYAAREHLCRVAQKFYQLHLRNRGGLVGKPQ